MKDGSSKSGAAVPLLFIMRVFVVLLAGWPGWLLISRSITAEFGAANLEVIDILTLGRATAEGLKTFSGVGLASLSVAFLLDQMLAVAAVRASSRSSDDGVWSTFWRDGPAWLMPLLKLALVGVVATAAVGALVNIGAERLATYGQKQGWTTLATVGGARAGQLALTGLLIAIVGAKIFWLRTAMLVSGRRALWRNVWHAPKWLWQSKGAVTLLGIAIWLLQIAGLALHVLMRPGHAVPMHWALWGVWIVVGAVVWLLAIRSSTRRYLAYERASVRPSPAPPRSGPNPKLHRPVEPPPRNVPDTNPIEVALPHEPEA